MEEAKLDDVAVACVEVIDGGAKNHSGLCLVETLLVVTDEIADRGGLGLSYAYVQRGRGEAAVGGQRLVDLITMDVKGICHLRRRRGVVVLLAELFADGGDLALQILDATWRADGPTVVTEVFLQLTRDRRDREGQEILVVSAVEAVNGLDQTEESHLFEVFRSLATAAITMRDRLGHAHVQLRHLLPQAVTLDLIGCRLDFCEQLTGTRAALRARRLLQLVVGESMIDNCHRTPPGILQGVALA